MKVAVCGGRDRHLKENTIRGDERSPTFMAVLSDELAMREADEIVTGGCAGIDLDAEDMAKRLGLKVTTFRPAWDTHGKAAGPLRNMEIARYADMLVAFPGGRGTDDMIRKMEALGKTVVRVTQRLEGGDVGP